MTASTERDTERTEHASKPTNKRATERTIIDSDNVLMGSNCCCAWSIDRFVLFSCLFLVHQQYTMYIHTHTNTYIPLYRHTQQPCCFAFHSYSSSSPRSTHSLQPCCYLRWPVDCHCHFQAWPPWCSMQLSNLHWQGCKSRRRSKCTGMWL